MENVVMNIFLLVTFSVLASYVFRGYKFLFRSSAEHKHFNFFKKKRPLS